MEGAPDDPDPDPDMRIHFFSTPLVSELLRKLIAADQDDFIDDLPKGVFDDASG